MCSPLQSLRSVLGCALTACFFGVAVLGSVVPPAQAQETNDTTRTDPAQVEPAPPESLSAPALTPPLEADTGPAADTGDSDRVDVSADSLRALERDGERLQELFENVFVRQDTTRLYSDYALRYRDRDELLFVDNVVIYERGDTLRADTVRYHRTTGVGQAWGNVRLTDGEVVVRAPRATYYADEKRSVFPDSVTLVDSSRVLHAQRGTYWSDEQRAEFGGNVRLTEPGTALEADSLTYFRDEERSIAQGRVFIDRRSDRTAADTTTRTYLFGNRADNRDRWQYSRVEGRALLVQIRFDSTGTPEDTLAVRAHRLDAFRTSTHRRLVAVDSVRIWQSDLAAVADSVVYDRVTAPTPDSTGRRTLPIDTVHGPPDSAQVLAQTNETGVPSPPSQGAPPDSLSQSGAENQPTENTPESPSSAAPPDSSRARPEQTARPDSSAQLGDSTRTAPASPWTTPTAQSDDELPLEETRLYRSPVTWFEDAQVWGDSIRVRARNRSPDTVFVRGSAFAAQRDSVLDRIQQLKAPTLTAFFRADTLRRIVAQPTAEAIRFVAAEDGSLSGASRTSGDRIVLRFAEGAVRRTSAIGGVQSTYYRKPENIPQPFELEGLRWTPDRRPTRYALLHEERVQKRLNLTLPERPPRLARAPTQGAPAQAPSSQAGEVATRYYEQGADTTVVPPPIRQEPAEEEPPSSDSLQRPPPAQSDSGSVTSRVPPPADTSGVPTAQQERVRSDTTDIPTTPQGRPGTPQMRPDSVPGGQETQDPSAQPGAPNGDDTPGIESSAKDSLVFVTDDESGNRGTLYGNAQMSYQDISLEAQEIEMDLDASELRATGPPSDTATAGRPTFQRGQQQAFSGQTLTYNLDSGRGRIQSARTQQRDAFVEADAIKMYEDSTFFGQQGTYTTCDCPPGVTPSYSLRASRMKVQGRWVYTGPIQMYLFNIPTPLWLPFGFLPNVQGRRSGPLAPDYGQDRTKGLFLRDWGWYFALNDYTDLRLQASIWSRGSFEVNPIFRYVKRYEYDGSLDLTYQRERIGEEQDPNFQNRHSGELRWSHSQDLSPTASIRGNVNLVTSSDFSRQNSRNYDDAVKQEIRSYVRYDKDWPGGGQNLNLSVRQNQHLQSGRVSMTLPNFNFSQRSFKPFERDQAVGENRWYEKITTSYDLSVRNSFSFRPRDPEEIRSRGDSLLADSLERENVGDIKWYQALVDRQQYRLATGQDEPFDLEAEHSIPLSASFRVNRFNLSLSPRINYTSDWYISTVRSVVRREEEEVSEDSTRIVEEEVERSVPGFYARHHFTTSFSSSTELYGLFPLRLGPLEGVRHRMRPSLSFSYTPNFNAPFWGRTRLLRYENGEPVRDEHTEEAIRYDILTGRTVRGSNEQRNLSFSLDNELETKRVRTDSTGERQEEKIKLLDFDLRSSYNFAADSLNLSDIDFNARTRFQDFSLRTSMTFSPYASRPTDTTGTNYRLYDRYLAADHPLKPVRLTRFRVDVSGSFDSGQTGGGAGGAVGGGSRSQWATQQRSRQRSSTAQNIPPGQNAAPGQREALRDSASASSSSSSPSTGYLDISVPWSLRFDFSYSFQKPGPNIQGQNATVNANFDLNITPNWSVQGRTGYDLIQNELALTRINLSRNLGCWQMSFSWVPFGSYRSYSFNLQVSSGQLAQLLQLQIPNSGEGRLGGFGNRLQGAAGGLARGAGGPGSFP